MLSLTDVLQMFAFRFVIESRVNHHGHIRSVCLIYFPFSTEFSCIRDDFHPNMEPEAVLFFALMDPCAHAFIDRI